MLGRGGSNFGRAHLNAGGSGADVGISAAELSELLALVTTERDTALEDVLVKNQMIVALANSLHSLRTELERTRGSVVGKDEQLQGAADETANLKSHVQGSLQRALAAERKSVALEDDLRATKASLAELHERMEAVVSLENEVKTLKAEKAQALETMEEWKANVRDALREQRKKEQQFVQTEIEQRVKLSQLQEQLDKTSFQLETLRLREISKAKASVEVQTDVSGVMAGGGGGGQAEWTPNNNGGGGAPGMPFSPGPPAVPLRDGSVAGPGAGVLLFSPEGRYGVAPYAQPGEIRPEDPNAASGGIGTSSSAAPGGAASAGAASSGGSSGTGGGGTASSSTLPPYIVTVHFGSGEDGWTVDTKHRVMPGTTIGQLINQVCEHINARFARQIDCAQMCLRTQHAKARRWIHLSDGREVHSFAYFGKCVREGQPIVLHLDPLPSAGPTLSMPPSATPSWLAVAPAAGGGLRGRSSSFQVPSTAPANALLSPAAQSSQRTGRERSSSASRALPRVASRSPTVGAVPPSRTRVDDDV